MFIGRERELKELNTLYDSANLSLPSFMAVGVLDTLINRSELFRFKNKHFYIFAKTEFTKAIVDKANEMGNVSLVRFADMID